MKRLFTNNAPVHSVALVEATLFVFTSSVGVILVKMGLAYMGPITLAALRFFLAFLVLLPFLYTRRGSLPGLTVRLWVRMFLLGVSAYTVGNAVGFWGLQYLQVSTAAFLMSFSPLLILVAGAVWLKETPNRLH